MIAPQEKLPENMTRVLIRHIYTDGLEFAFYKDGMFLCDSGSEWMSPKQVKGWLSINDLKIILGIR